MNRFFPNYEDYKITSPYGKRILLGVTRMHNGIDLVARATNGASCVDHITAHTGGIVSAVGYQPDGAGYYIYIQVSADVEMAYFHLRAGSIKVKKGEKVAKGQAIAYMGSTGRSTGAHLHWGIKVKGVWIDPTPYLDSDYPTSTINPTVKESGTVNITMNVLQKGSKGSQVKTLQRLLVALGYNVGAAGIDGDFGNDTESATKKFQKDKVLIVDGIVGANTWNKLLK